MTDMFRYFAFRHLPRVYGTTQLLGHEALVTEDDGKTVTVVTHDLCAFGVLKLERGQFLESFVPDLSLDPGSHAVNMHAWFHNIRPEGQSASLVEAAIKKQPKLEDLTVSKPKGKPNLAAHVCQDFNRRTCIVVERTEARVVYVPLTDQGLDVVEAPVDKFDRDYKLLDGYPVEKAAKLYVEYARHLGSAKEAMAALGRLVQVPQADVDAALKARVAMQAKRPAPAETPKFDDKHTERRKQRLGRAAAKVAEQRPVVRVAKQDETDLPWDEEPVVKAARKPGGASVKPQETAKSRAEGVGTFCEHLILKGKSNEEVLAAAKKQFPDKNPSASSINWYRNKLKREGKI